MATVTKTSVEPTALIDKKMSEAFDWSDSKKPVWEAIWNHFMEKNTQDTMKTAEDVKWILKADDDKITSWCEENLK